MSTRRKSTRNSTYKEIEEEVAAEEEEVEAEPTASPPADGRKSKGSLEKNYSGTGWTRRTQGQSLWHRASVLAKPAATLAALSSPEKPKGRSSGSGLASKLKGAAGKVSGALDKDKVMPLMKFLVIAILGGLLLYLTGVALSQAFEAEVSPVLSTEPGAAQLKALEKRMQSKLSTSEYAILARLKATEEKVEGLSALSGLKSKVDSLVLLAERASSLVALGSSVPDDLKALAARVDQIASLSDRASAAEASSGDAQSTAEELTALRAALEGVVDKVEAQEKKVKDAVSSWQGSQGTTRKHVMEELEKFAADRTGRVDYAAYTGASSPARVVEHSTLSRLVAGSPGTFLLSLLGNPVVHPDANEKLLRPGIEAPGDCLALNGTTGYVDIKLRAPVEVAAVTLEHIPPSIAYNADSAPKGFSVFGSAGATPSEAAMMSPPELVHLLEGSYSLQAPEGMVQTFPTKGKAAKKAVDHVRLQITSNHGHPDYTCVYRIRVHGKAIEAK